MPMSKGAKKSRSVIVRLLVLFLVSYMMITLIGLFREYRESKDKLVELKEDLKKEQLQVEEYKALLKDGSHADIIEKAARERLGFVYSNEEVYVDISGN
ncbi:MAG: septum formation initiator family protein [Clostridia bacterium]|nr:septum formation initiator family protein [Clostridia bacterium]